VFLTRSIRRKLVIGLGLVCLMLGIQALAGFTGLMSYRAVVQQLEYQQTQEPHRTHLAVACAGLFDAVLVPERLKIQPGDSPFAAVGLGEARLGFDPDVWADRVEVAREELAEFRRRVDRLPTSTAIWHTQSVMHSKLDLIHVILRRLEQGRKQLSVDEIRAQVLEAMLRDIAQIQSIIQEIPNPERGTEATLKEAPAIYKSRLVLIGGCLLLIPFLFVFLVRCGHKWIFVPVRKLHEAAARVANGDYSHRLKLEGKDEIVDLASVFNRMIERFQRDKEKLDREVEERSRQLLRNERLAGIGFLATGIAHEINNPLSAVAMAAESLIGRLKEAGDQFGTTESDRELLKTYLEMIQRQSNRCQQITTRVLDFSRNSTARQRHDLTKIVAEVLDMVSHMSRFGHHTIVFDRSRSYFVDVNAPEIQQVIINLVANGLEAMDAAGTMRISIAESLDEVVLTVEDTGCGMTPHVLANLYEPFFTEKLPGKKGTGLGLSITNRIVADHDGRIEASSDGPGCGSTFRVHLPRAAGTARRVA